MKKFCRNIIATALLASVVTSLSTVAMAQQPSAQIRVSQAGWYRLPKIGDYDIVALSDGTLSLSAVALLTNTTTDHVTDLLAQTDKTNTVDISINAYLIVAGDRKIMVDAGTNLLYGPNLNKLPASLKAVGVDPRQITDILITHIHTDHTGGLMDGDRMVFPNATIHVDKRELDYWLNPNNLERAPESGKKLFQEAVMKMKPYVDAGKVKTFNGFGWRCSQSDNIAIFGHIGEWLPLEIIKCDWLNWLRKDIFTPKLAQRETNQENRPA